jgi:hypothetical protein
LTRGVADFGSPPPIKSGDSSIEAVIPIAAEIVGWGEPAEVVVTVIPVLAVVGDGAVGDAADPLGKVARAGEVHVLGRAELVTIPVR